MPVIYQPKGAAFEYSPLALNLYNGCAHGCKYCYAPACMHKSRDQFIAPQPRKDVLQNLAKEAPKYSGDPRPVLLCFTTDPYQPCEKEHQLTRQAIEILGENNVKVRVLTKNPSLAVRDFDLFRKYDVELGVTLIWTDDADRKEWEPNAGCVKVRGSVIMEARAAGIRTWVSIEPVIDPVQALGVIDGLHNYVDRWSIGKLNHDKEREALVDWDQFLADVLKLMYKYGCNYYIKHDLWKFAADWEEIGGKARGVTLYTPVAG